MNQPKRTHSSHKTPYQDDSPVGGFPAIDFREILALYLRKWWVIVTCVTIAALGAGYYIYEQPKLYESQAVIFVGQENDRVAPIQAVTPDDFRDLAELKTVEQSLASSAVILRVAKANGLVDDPTFIRRKSDGEAPTDNAIIAVLGNRVSATLRRGTRLIDIKVRDTDPDRAKLLAGSFVEEFTQMNHEQQLNATRRAKMSLLEEADRLKMKLDDSERRLQAYRENFPDLPLEGAEKGEGNLVLDKLKALNVQLSTARAERLRLETEVEKLATIDRATDAETILGIGTVAQLAEVVDLTKLINQKESEFAKIGKRYLFKHPTYISAQSELNDLKDSLRRAALNAGQNIRGRYEAAKENEAKLAAAVETQNALAMKMDEALIDYNTLAREVESDRALHKSVVTRHKEMDVAEGFKAGHLRLMVTPLVSEQPVWPRQKLTMAIAIAFGGVIGSVFVFLLNWYQGTTVTSAQLERVLGVPALANVIEGGFSGENDSLVVRTDPQSPISESFRMLRSSLAFLGNGHQARSVLFTSSTPNEGKSFCAANYAIALASQGHRTLLIDSDLRRPTIGKLFYREESGLGLSDYLDGDVQAGQICRRSGTENLFVITAGRSKPNPAELMGDQRILNLVREAFRWFDRVIIDTSPLGLVSDALPLARSVDATCLVVRSGKTPQRDVLRTSRYLEMAGAPLAGFVLNRVRQESQPKSYYYHYNEEAKVEVQEDRILALTNQR